MSVIEYGGMSVDERRNKILEMLDSGIKVIII